MTALLILLSNIDDGFVDLYFIIHQFRRKLFVYRKFRPFQGEDLLAGAEQYFAVMIPAWQEAAVIQAMIKNTLSSYQYHAYHLFIGCYPNDPACIARIEPLLLHHPRLHMTLMPVPGPTSKADCLNHIYQDIVDFEQGSAVEFAGIVLHDAEDIVHPLELKLYNHLMPKKDMIQIPVIPLERPWYDLTGGHYQDEFAENHIQELVVRESLTGHVPSAGVGTALSRRAMAAITDDHRDPFECGNLTEDYDLALRLKRHNLKLIFVRFCASPGDIIATREFFPNSISAVMRQKSRWLMGIAFQGWHNQGWQGSLALKYALFRDRKGIVTAQLSVAAYFILFNILVVGLLEWAFPGGYRYPPLVHHGEILEYLLWGNLLFLINRSLHRFYFSRQIYGTLAGLMSLPRQLWGNILNFLATIRAIRLYSHHLLTGAALVWDKTDHMFPERAQLAPYHKKLGEILMQNRLVGAASLRQALSSQKSGWQAWRNSDQSRRDHPSAISPNPDSPESGK